MLKKSTDLKHTKISRSAYFQNRNTFAKKYLLTQHKKRKKITCSNYIKISKKYFLNFKLYEIHIVKKVPAETLYKPEKVLFVF